MSRRVEKIERVADLLFVLLNAKEPLTLVQIASMVPGYPTEEEARRTSFERDKKTLRDSGIHITVSAPNSSAQDGYQILAADYYLPDLSLSDSERKALRLALASVRFEGTVHAEIAVKIGADPESALPAVMELPREAALGTLGVAVQQRSVVTFTYHGTKRTIEPGSLYFRSGHWYLIGRNHPEGVTGLVGVIRTFRVDRIQGAIGVGEPDAFEPSDHPNFAQEIAFSLRSSIDADETAEPRTLLELLVDPSATASVIEVIGQDVVLARDEEGRAKVVFPIADEEAVISWILGLGSAAEVLAPVALRDQIIDRLRLLAAEAPPDASAFPEVPRSGSVRSSGSPQRSVRSALDAGARLRRMIAMLTFLANEGAATIPELASRFGIDEQTVTAELELAACFGRPPYTPDELLEVIIIDDEVYVNQLESLERPLRLTPDEGFALAAAARTLLQVEGVTPNSPLATGLAKLESVLGEHHVHVEVTIPPLLEELRRSAATNKVIEIDYLASGQTNAQVRRVEPYAVPFREGRFYLDAFCREADDWRRFAVTNIVAVRVTDEPGETRTLPTEFLGSRAFVESEDTTQAVIVAGASHRYFLEPLVDDPLLAIDDDRVLAVVSVGDPEWLGRLLLRLGAGAQVISPPALRSAKADAATDALGRY